MLNIGTKRAWFLTLTGSLLCLSLAVGLAMTRPALADEDAANGGADAGDAPRMDDVAEKVDAAEDEVDADLDLAELLRLPRMAEQGEFIRMLDVVESGRIGDDRLIGHLAEALKRHKANKEARSERLAEAYDRAIERMESAVDEGRYEQAIYRAIEARSSAPDPKQMLEAPYVTEVVEEVLARAEKAVDDRHWLDALGIYRALNLLYEYSDKYREPMKLVERRVSLIRLYAPENYSEMYVEHLKRQGEEDPEAPNLPDSDWEDRLENITSEMLHDALFRAERLHVAQEGYQPLLAGMIDGLKVFLDTPALVDTFSGLEDGDALETLQRELRQIDQEVRENGDRRIDSLTASGYVDRILRTNRLTVELPERVVIHELANGAMASLDEYSGMIWPSELSDLERTLRGSFTGVGIQIEQRQGRLTVSSPLEGTPAHQAGIQPGDVIATVDGRSTEGWSLDRAVREITGPEGTEVVLEIERAGVDDPIEVPIERAPIAIQSVMGWQRKEGGGWDYYIDPELKIGYIRLTTFNPDTRDDLIEALERMEEDKGLNGLVLDLRGNPGGLLSAATEVADLFVNEGVLVSTVGPREMRNETHYARADRTRPYFPMTVLIDTGSASASEIVAGALQDHHRAQVVGSRSWGKGSVQIPLPVDDARARVKLTIQQYRLPGGRLIHREPGDETWGIEPDLEIRLNFNEVEEVRNFRRELDILRDNNGDSPAAMPEDQDNDEPPRAEQLLTDGIDPQLEAGLLMLTTRLVARDIALAEIQRKPEEAASP